MKQIIITVEDQEQVDAIIENLSDLEREGTLDFALDMDDRPIIELDADEYMLMSSALNSYLRAEKSRLKSDPIIKKYRKREIKKLSKKLDNYANASADWVHDNLNKF